MPITLHEKAIGWGEITLARNDIIMEIVTPASNYEVKTYTSEYERRALEREFHERSENSRWDAFIYYVPPEQMDDENYKLDAKAMFHIHMFAVIVNASGLVIEKLLPKSEHVREGRQLNLADEPVDRWESLVSHMHSRTKIVIERFKTHYVDRFMVRP